MTDRRPFIAVVRLDKLYMRKFVPHDNESWSAYIWSAGHGWLWGENVGDATAADWREAADEVFIKEPKP